MNWLLCWSDISGFGFCFLRKKEPTMTRPFLKRRFPFKKINSETCFCCFQKCFLETKIMSFSLHGTWFLKIYFQNNSQKLLSSYYIINISYWLIFYFIFSKLQLQVIIPAFSPTPFLFWVFFLAFILCFYVFFPFFIFILCCSSQSCTLIFQIMKVNIIKLTICMLNLIKFDS